MKAFDHKGIEYPSKSAMCEAYGISLVTYNSRMKSRGWTKAKALTTPVAKVKGVRKWNPVTDPKGVEYPSIKDMCKAYRISISTYNNRRQLGWTQEDALTAPVRESSKPVTDPRGIEYASIAEMCRAYNITRANFDERMRTGWSLEKALTTPVAETKKTVTDHTGVKYPSVAEMCRAYDVPYITFNNRMTRGWSLEKALTTPVRARRTKQEVEADRDLQSVIEKSGLSYDQAVEIIKNSASSSRDALETKG